MPPPLPRDAFPVTTEWTYLDHAGISAMSAPAAEAMAAYARDSAAAGRVGHAAHAPAAERVRRGAALLLGVPPADVALTKNTTEGLAFVAGGLGWRPGDRVVVAGGTFPSVALPWLSLRDRGVVVDLVEPVAGRLPVERYAERIAGGPPPRLVMASWVNFSSGWRTDLAGLAEVCRQAGALLCVDAIQGLGVVPADLERWGVDFAAAGAQKWLLGPPGVGVLYIRRSRLDALRPPPPGWNAVAQRGDWQDLRVLLDDDARRFEGGSHNIAGLAGVAASLDLILAAGVEAIWSHVTRLLGHACARLEGAGAEILSDRSEGARSSIVVFRPPRGEPEAVVAELRDRGIVVVARGAGVRLAPHGYNTLGDIDDLIDGLAAVA